MPGACCVPTVIRRATAEAGHDLLGVDIATLVVRLADAACRLVLAAHIDRARLGTPLPAGDRGARGAGHRGLREAP